MGGPLTVGGTTDLRATTRVHAGLHVDGPTGLNGDLAVAAPASGRVWASRADTNQTENVATLTGALGKVVALRGVSFDWQDTGETAIGLLAQETAVQVPEVVYDLGGAKHVAYGNLIGLLVEAIKELRAEVAALGSG